MQKLCANCRSSVSDECSFCPVCGSSSFFSGNPGETTVLSAGIGGSPQMPYPPAPPAGQPQPSLQQQPFFQPAPAYAQQPVVPQETPVADPQPVYSQQPAYPPQPPYAQQPAMPNFSPDTNPFAVPYKKKSNKGLIFGAIAIGLVVLIVIISSLRPKEPDLYTKGELIGSVYTNEWANIKFTLPDDFYDADNSVYETVDDDAIDCALYCFRQDGAQALCITFEKLSSKSCDEDEYLNGVMNHTTKSSNKYIPSGNYSTVKIAGDDYRTIDYITSEDFLNDPSLTTIRLFAHKQDGYMIFIFVISNSSKEIDPLMERFESIK